MRTVANLLPILLLAAVGAHGQLSSEGNQVFAQGAGIPGAPDNNDFFGNAMAAGDFNGDGFLDLAVGVPGDNNGQARGAVNVIYGRTGGLTGQGAQEWIQGENGLDGNDERDDLFGSALAAGDFNNDGYDDLAVGVPGEDGGRGIVAIIYGSASGLNSAGNQVFDQSDLEGTGRQTNNLFASVLAAGDFNGDGFADLSIGTPRHNNFRGIVHVMYGASGGLSTSGNQRFRQGADGLEGDETDGDQFGNDLAAADVNGDGFDDLAVAVPGEDSSKGGVQLLFGSAGRLTGDGDVFLRQDDLLGDDRDDFDAFGSAVAAGDFNQDGFEDLAISAIGEDNGRGSVIVVNGAQNGATGPAVQWRQGLDGLLGEQNSGDRFGTDFAVGDFNADGFPDLAVGARGEAGNSGIVHVIYGSIGGLTAAGNQVFSQGVDGMDNVPESGDDFGAVLVAGNFGRGGADDLAVAAPREDGDRGIVHIIYGLTTQSPTISGIVGAGLSQPFVAKASYNQIMTIFGERFATEGFARIVSGADLINGLLPVRFGGVCVEIGGQRAPIFAVFDNQINFQAIAPIGVPGATTVRVIRNCDSASELISGPVEIETAAAAPEFFFFVQTQTGVNPVAAVNETTRTLVGQPGLLPGAIFEPARPGDIVTLYVTGLGETAPLYGPGELPPGAAATARPVTVRLGATDITPLYAGVTPFNAGLYQVSFEIPAGVVASNIQIQLIVGAAFEGFVTPPGAFILIGE